MSHQTGITASDELRVFFGHAKDGSSVRLLSVAIEEEQLVLSSYEPPYGSWETDWDKLIGPLLVPEKPCFIFYRLDSKNNQGYEWIYITYTPDHAPVKEKMMYAATKATLKTEFGSGHIKDELFGTLPDEVKIAGYKRHLMGQDEPAPLSMAEAELALVKKTEVNVAVNVDTKQQTLSGVAFPVSHEALVKLEELQDRVITYVQLEIDLEGETIELASYDTIEAAQLQRKIPLDHARYHFFIFKHTHEGDYLESIVFMYSVPGYKCSIKERMLYSSCKAPLLDMCEQNLGMEFARKVEVDDPKEVNEQFLYEEVHPKKTIVREKFAKPRGPAGRGPRRITKSNEQQPSE